MGPASDNAGYADFWIMNKLSEISFNGSGVG